MVIHCGQSYLAPYSASKAALVGLARSLASELASAGVTSNVVAPGPIDTELLRSLGDKRLDELRAVVPTGRLGDPREVAAVVGFLCGDGSSFVTGAMIPVDGGLLASGGGLQVRRRSTRSTRAPTP
mgnify:CR=1 FL=1